MTKTEMTAAILAAKKKKKLSWEKLAEKVGMSPVWTTSACLGQNSMPAELAKKTVRALGLKADVAAALEAFPSKGDVKAVPTDPLLYRFHEINLVYGTTIKELIHEKMGDGIMSAIDFSMHLERVEDPKGPRVKITMNGKFLPYKTW
jgi:cyanate lyase